MSCILVARTLIRSAPIIVALFICGCGGGSLAGTSKRDATAAHTTAVKTSLTETVAPQVVARDRALGERALLRESDFSSEYAAAPRGAQNRRTKNVRRNFF
jgi:hypothetical protein